MDPPATCDDGNPCTDDFCDADAGCRHTLREDGTPCPDGNVCNGAEWCQTGVCTSGRPLACDDGDPCTDDGCDAVQGCVATPKRGYASVFCRLDVIDTALSSAGPNDVRVRLRTKLAMHAHTARNKMTTAQRATSKKGLLKALKAATSQMNAIASQVNGALAKGKIARPVGEVILSAAKGTSQAIETLRGSASP
jgi:hypothetical protein